MLLPVTTKQHLGMWAKLRPIAETYGPRLFLGHALLKKEHGGRHGGMGTGAVEEDLWTTAFRRHGLLQAGLPSCTQAVPPCTQADCSIVGQDGVYHPLSIKCTSSAIAVNWGKNKTKVPFRFIAPLFVVWHPRARREHKAGVYMVDPTWCQANVAFAANNKTDHLINAAELARMLSRARDIDTFHEVDTDQAPGIDGHCVFRNPHTREVEVIRMPTREEFASLRL